MNKAHASMEFLMTYIWAILAVLISIAALAYFGILSPGHFLPDSCILFPGLACTDVKIEPNQITLSVRNGIGYELKSVSISLPPNICTTGDSKPTLSEGVTYQFQLTGCSLTPGSRINEELTIIYTGKTISYTRTGKVAGIVESVTITTSTSTSSTSTTTTSTTLAGATTTSTTTSSTTTTTLSWGGKTIDEPYTTSDIELVSSDVVAGYRRDFFKNKAYTCGVSGYQTFTVVYPSTYPVAEVHPLWVRMHGGGGIWGSNGSETEEPLATLAGQLTETGLMYKIRTHPTARFRFLMVSKCDNDLYSGVGVPIPGSPLDENGVPRTGDGLLATKAAIQYTRDNYATSHIFLHGTSAGAMGAFPAAYTLEREGKRLSGIVMDSGVYGQGLYDLTASGCTQGTLADLQAQAQTIGPISDPINYPDQVVLRGEMTVPILHLWNRGDPTYCGDDPFTYTDDQGQQQTMGSTDYLNERLRAAIQTINPGGSSENLRVCVTPATGGSCSTHSPTRYAYTEANPDGDTDHPGALDYNLYIMNWVDSRLNELPP